VGGGEKMNRANDSIPLLYRKSTISVPIIINVLIDVKVFL
jgi:hypothetical protein